MRKNLLQNPGSHSESLFEKKVLSGLAASGIDVSAVSEKSPLGLAVSGGADSVSLLVSLSSVFDSSFLRVITIDHGIRPEEESGGDADFVKDLCKKIGIFCHVEKIPRGYIEGLSKKSSQSVEALARKVRYEAFASFIKNENLLALCLAHNQNDLCETVIMRFLQGSGSEGLSGIPRVRDKYVRPLLELSRSEIEAYLRKKNQAWRTDATNSDIKYLRNRIRNVLVPVLNENFPGWQKGLISGSKKAASDEDFLTGLLEIPADKACRDNKSCIRIDRSYFYSLHPAIGRRVFFDCLNKIGFGARFPYRCFEEILSWRNAGEKEVFFENVRVSLDSKNLVIEICGKNFPAEKASLEGGFYFVFRKAGDCAECGDFLIRAQATHGSACHSLSFLAKNPGPESFSLDVSLPLLVRSFIAGDEIKTSLGEFKALSDIFTDWKVPAPLREKALVIELLPSKKCRDSFLKAFIASHLGFKNWIVEEAKL